MITCIKEAKAVLEQDAQFMIAMEMNGSCWIKAGVRDRGGVLVADGRRICQISEDIFNDMAKEMQQESCSEYFQARANAA